MPKLVYDIASRTDCCTLGCLYAVGMSSDVTIGIEHFELNCNIEFPSYIGKPIITIIRAVIVAQLVERSLLMPEVRSLNPVIGKLLSWTFNCLPIVNCIEKTKIKKKRLGMAHLKNYRITWSTPISLSIFNFNSMLEAYNINFIASIILLSRHHSRQIGIF